MARLTAETLHGIWAGITMSWDEHDRFDEDTYAKNIERALAAKVHGVYTTGSTGEFYAIDDDEFQRMVDIQDELCGAAGMPLQIGCCADATRKTLRLLEYVNGKANVGAAQVTVPYWMELTDAELLRFFADIESFVVARGEGCIDPVFDKGLGVASGCVLGHQRCRAPYIGWSDETVAALREHLQEKWPEFVYAA